MPDVLMIPTRINGRWYLTLPEHRAAREQWGDWTDGAGVSRFGWETERLNSMCDNILQNDIVYDIGAEEGDMSALYASWGADLCLFEPNDRVWPNIKAIWQANDLRSPLYCWSGFAGNLDRYESPPMLENAGAWPSSADGPLIGDHGFCNLGERDDIPSITLDTFATYAPLPDVITMDVEGSEFHVLAGAMGLLAHAKPLVYISVHPQFMKEMYDVEAQALHDLMAQLGYREKHLDTDHEEHWVFWHPEGRGFKL